MVRKKRITYGYTVTVLPNSNPSKNPEYYCVWAENSSEAVKKSIPLGTEFTEHSISEYRAYQNQYPDVTINPVDGTYWLQVRGDRAMRFYKVYPAYSLDTLRCSIVWITDTLVRCTIFCNCDFTRSVDGQGAIDIFWDKITKEYTYSGVYKVLPPEFYGSETQKRCMELAQMKIQRKQTDDLLLVAQEGYHHLSYLDFQEQKLKSVQSKDLIGLTYSVPKQLIANIYGRSAELKPQKGLLRAGRPSIGDMTHSASDKAEFERSRWYNFSDRYNRTLRIEVKEFGRAGGPLSAVNDPPRDGYVASVDLRMSVVFKGNPVRLQLSKVVGKHFVFDNEVVFLYIDIETGQSFVLVRWSSYYSDTSGFTNTTLLDLPKILKQLLYDKKAEYHDAVDEVYQQTLLQLTRHCTVESIAKIFKRWAFLESMQ